MDVSLSHVILCHCMPFQYCWHLPSACPIYSATAYTAPGQLGMSFRVVGVVLHPQIVPPPNLVYPIWGVFLNPPKAHPEVLEHFQIPWSAQGLQKCFCLCSGAAFISTGGLEEGPLLAEETPEPTISGDIVLHRIGPPTKGSAMNFLEKCRSSRKRALQQDKSCPSCCCSSPEVHPQHLEVKHSTALQPFPSSTKAHPEFLEGSHITQDWDALQIWGKQYEGQAYHLLL